MQYALLLGEGEKGRITIIKMAVHLDDCIFSAVPKRILMTLFKKYIKDF